MCNRCESHARYSILSVRLIFSVWIDAEFFNVFNRNNPGANYIANVAALPNVPTAEAQTGNVTDICANAACTSTTTIRSLQQLAIPAGGLGDFFGPGTTVGIPLAAQLGVRTLALCGGQKIHTKLGGTGSTAEDLPEKPKWMHWKTYSKLSLEYRRCIGNSWPPFLMKRLGFAPGTALE